MCDFRLENLIFQFTGDTFSFSTKKLISLVKGQLCKTNHSLGVC